MFGLAMENECLTPLCILVHLRTQLDPCLAYEDQAGHQSHSEMELRLYQDGL